MLGRSCLVHAGHVDEVPIEGHHVRPRPRGGGDAQVIELCANAHGRVHMLLDAIEDYAFTSPFATSDEILRTIPRATWERFDVVERQIAYRGWQSYGLGFLNHRYDSAYRLWRTDGTPKTEEAPMFDDLFHAARWSRRWRRELGSL